MTGETLAAVAARGNRRETLLALRGALARQLDDAAPRDAAALARQMQAVLREIDEIPTAEQETPGDEIKRKREARLARRVAGS